MATVKQKILTCDVCGDANDVQTCAFRFDGKRYEIDLCPKDRDGLNKVVAGYSSKARKVTARRGQRSNGHRPNASRPAQQAGKASGARAKSAGAKKEAKADGSQPREVMAAPEQAAKASRSQPHEVMAVPEQAATTSRSEAQEVMAAPKQAAKASHSEAQEMMAAPKQAATTSRSEAQEVMAAPKQAATRSQPQKARAAPKQAATRSQPQKAKAASKQAATASRSQSQKAKAAPKQAATRSQPQKARAAPKQAATRSQPRKAKAALKGAATAGRSLSQKGKAAAKQASKASGMKQEKGIYVYGILPADIEVAGETQGVGEHPGPLGIVYSDGLAALISEVELPARLGSPEDMRIHREILDSTAIDLPVVPLRFGTVFTGKGSVADELLAPRHDEFATALEQLEGRAQFIVKGRYVEEALTAGREEDTRALQQAMKAISVDSVVREPAHEREAVHVAFLVDVDEEPEVERVIEDLAGEWDGRIEVRLLGPMAAYDFVMTDSD
jgi:Gas vesicle synthesis protein GvpL/GvpF/Lsr2